MAHDVARHIVGALQEQNSCKCEACLSDAGGLVCYVTDRSMGEL